MRKAYKKVKNGRKADSNLSQDRIEHLEEIGCQWQGIDCDGEFEKRCHGLKAIKGKFGIQHWKDGVATRK